MKVLMAVVSGALSVVRCVRVTLYDVGPFRCFVCIRLDTCESIVSMHVSGAESSSSPLILTDFICRLSQFATVVLR